MAVSGCECVELAQGTYMATA